MPISPSAPQVSSYQPNCELALSSQQCTQPDECMDDTDLVNEVHVLWAVILL